MTTLRASGQSFRGSPRSSARASIQPMSPCAPSPRKARSRSAASGTASGPVTRTASKPSARARSTSASLSSEVEIRIGRGRRHARDAVGEEGAEGGAGFDAGIPGLRGLVLVPGHVAEVIDAGYMGRGREIRSRQRVAGEPVPRADQIADIAQMVTDVGAPGMDHAGIGRAAALARRQIALEHLLVN